MWFKRRKACPSPEAIQAKKKMEQALSETAELVAKVGTVTAVIKNEMERNHFGERIFLSQQRVEEKTKIEMRNA